MLFPARTRKALLTVHVSCSVGWLGAVLVFLALMLFLGIKYPVFFTLAGFSFLAVAVFYVQPLAPIISLLMAAAGVMLALWGVKYFFN